MQKRSKFARADFPALPPPGRHDGSAGRSTWPNAARGPITRRSTARSNALHPRWNNVCAQLQPMTDSRRVDATYVKMQGSGFDPGRRICSRGDRGASTQTPSVFATQPFQEAVSQGGSARTARVQERLNRTHRVTIVLLPPSNAARNRCNPSACLSPRCWCETLARLGFARAMLHLAPDKEARYVA